MDAGISPLLGKSTECSALLEVCVSECLLVNSYISKHTRTHSEFDKTFHHTQHLFDRELQLLINESMINF